jgi:hypothetical protein
MYVNNWRSYLNNTLTNRCLSRLLPLRKGQFLSSYKIRRDLFFVVWIVGEDVFKEAFKCVLDLPV